MRVKSITNHIAAKDLIEQLASTGRYHFSSEEAQKALKVPQDASKLALNRLAKQGGIASPARSFNMALGELHVSTPEVTAIDLVGYPEHVSGLNQVVTILSELADEINPELLVEAARLAPITWAQRYSSCTYPLQDTQKILTWCRSMLNQRTSNSRFTHNLIARVFAQASGHLL